MIIDYKYNSAGGRRDFIKKYIRDQKLENCIDIGASAMFWSYPECNFVADIVDPSKNDVTFFKINLEDKNTWKELLETVELNGKFDFSICSHTLEDVFNPIDLIELLQKISNSGFFAIPSKWDEMSFLHNNNYRGNAHHKQFFDISDDKLIIYPKFSWIENNSKSDELLLGDQGRELSFIWHEKIPFKVFGKDRPFNSDGELILNFYNDLIKK